MPAPACALSPAQPALTRRLVALAAALVLVLGLAVQTTTPAAAAAGNPAATAVHYALYQLGKPYSYGGSGPSSYDCSGLTSQAYLSAGVSIPRVSRDQYRLLPRVPLAQARPGDLIFWATNPADPATIHHVALYLGSNQVVDSPRSGSVVQVRTLWTSGLMAYAARPAAANAATLLPVEPGSSGHDVRAVQFRLRANGYDVSTDGSYGSQTLAAVRALQLRMGLSGSGLVGPSTWGYLVTNGLKTSRN